MCRSTSAQLATNVAFAQTLITSSRLPVWSMSSWEMNTHFTSSGSTSENASSSHCLRLAIVPVSTITGSAPVMTIELMYTESGAPNAGCSWWMR